MDHTKVCRPGEDLVLADSFDPLIYEKMRHQLRTYIIGLKKNRRVQVGPFQTLLFENRQTIQFQVQEMARAERITTDQGIQGELDAYNPLISRPGRLSATLFLELTSDEELRRWLPASTQVERHYELRLGVGSDAYNTTHELPGRIWGLPRLAWSDCSWE